MAGEAQIINNPTSLPVVVSTAYQAQNTRFISQANGIDKTVITGGAGSATLQISGPVDFNGTLYAIDSAVTLTPESGAGTYYVYLDDVDTDTLTPTLTQDSGTFDATKNAHYTDADSYRILNWIIFYDGTTCYVNKWVTPNNDDYNDYSDVGSAEDTWITANGTWTAKRSKYYTFTLTGSGGDGGDVNTVLGGNNTAMGGGGGGATGIVRKFIEAGDTWTATFSASESGDTTFTDGTTSLAVENGIDAQDYDDLTCGHGGIGGNNYTGTFDQFFEGGSGHGGSQVEIAGTARTNRDMGGNGGASFWSGGGRGAVAFDTTYYPSYTGNKGSGGGGGAQWNVAYLAQGSLGGSGLIRIQG